MLRAVGHQLGQVIVEILQAKVLKLHHAKLVTKPSGQAGRFRLVTGAFRVFFTAHFAHRLGEAVVLGYLDPPRHRIIDAVARLSAEH